MSESIELVQLKADVAMERWSRGRTRIPLRKCGCDPNNRKGWPLSSKHMHYIGWRIVTKEGFSSQRYTNGVVVQPHPDHPRRVYNHTASFCDRDPLMISALESMEFGCSRKSHLLLFLLALLDGGIVSSLLCLHSPNVV